MCGRISFVTILEAVAAEHDVTVEHLRGPSVRGSYAKVNWPRQRALMIARRVLPALSWGQLSTQMNGRSRRNLGDQAQAAEKRYRAMASERRAVGRILARLGLDELPAYDELQWQRVRLDREIQALERKLTDMRAARAELGEAA